MEFVAIDVETANQDMASICQIGIAKYDGDQLVDSWCTLVNPKDVFSRTNVRIHGITEEHVEGAPTFPEIASSLRGHMENSLCVCHTHFDRVSITQAIARHELDYFACAWMDSAEVVRRAWPQFSKKGYGLANICKELGYDFKHHDALEDARAAGFVLLEAIKVSGIPLEEWPERGGAGRIHGFLP